MNETKPVQEIEQRTSAIVHEAAARGAEKIQSVDITSGARSFSRAFHRAAECLREEGYPTVANVTDQFADKLGNVRVDGGRDPMSMVRDAQRFARDNPAAFILGCAAVGFALSRFLSTSSDEGRDVPIAPSVYGGTP